MAVKVADVAGQKRAMGDSDFTQAIKYAAELKPFSDAIHLEAKVLLASLKARETNTSEQTPSKAGGKKRSRQ
eukprot:3980624-Pyramimonas_sp.AAC.2